MAILELRWSHIPEWECGEERRFLDYIVDGNSLSVYLDPQSEYGLNEQGGWITGLGWGNVRATLEAIDEFTLVAPSRFPEIRNPFYICVACGDPGCGAFTAVVRREGEYIVWEEFVRFASIHGEPGEYQLPDDLRRQSFDAGPFYFEVGQYLETFRLPRDEVRTRT